MSGIGRWLLVPIAAAGCAGDPLATAETTAAVEALAPDRSEGATRLVSGLLTPPSSAAPAEVVQSYLAAHPRLAAGAALETASVRPMATGALVTLRQRHRDLPVLGAAVTARTDAAGRLRWLRSSAVAVPADLDLAPALAADQVLDRLAGEPRLAGRSLAGADLSLVVFALGAHAGAPRLAWQIDLPADLARMEALRLHADAASGALLSVVDRVRRAGEHRARLYALDPVNTPERSEVILEHLPAGADTLVEQSFEVWNCVDRRECTEVSAGGEPQVIHFCSFEKGATAGPYGDFLALDPPEDHTAFGDPFAEVQAYYHVRKALDFVRARLGAPDLLDDVTFTVVANAPGQVMGQPEFPACVDGEVPADSQFVPLENAFFAPFHEIPGVPPPLDSPSMVFGQGAAGDFAYGGDVAYHEFGHGMFHFIGSREMGGKRVPDAFGIDPSPGAMDEGFADYLAISIAGDPVIGKYALGTAEGFRTAANQKTCPADIHGEEHDDSEPWSGALWAIRQALPEEQRAGMDAAVLTTMMAITDADDFKTVADMLVAEMETALGYDPARVAREELSARGFADECNRRVRVLNRDDSHERLFAHEPGPAVLQFRVDVPERTDRIELTGKAAQLAAGGAPPAATLRAKPGEDPIQWSWQPAGEGGAPASDATLSAPITFTAVEAEPGVFDVSAVLAGDFAPGSYHLQIDSADPVGLIFGKLTSPTGLDGKADDPGEAEEGGCSAGGGAGPTWLVLLAALALIGRRWRAPAARGTISRT